MRIVQLTDLHLTAEPGQGFHGLNCLQQFEAALTNSLTLAPDLVLLTGDQAQEPSPTLYAALMDCLEAHWSGPWLWTPGNHDCGADMMAALRRRHRDVPEHSCYRSGRIAVHTLDTHIDDQPEGRVAAEERQRILEVLRAEQADIVLIAGHHPLFTVGTAWLDKHVPEQGAELAAALAAFPSVRAYLCGHVHQASDLQRHGLRQLSAPATSVQFEAGSPQFSLGAARPAYRWLDVRDDGSVQTACVQL